MPHNQTKHGRGVTTVNPSDGTEIAHYPFLDTQAIDATLEGAAVAYRTWRQKPLEERLKHLSSFASQSHKRRDELARMATTEMGKPMTAARSEIDKCIQTLQWYCERAPSLLADKPLSVPIGTAHLRYEPLGTVFAVMPWNFPFWQILRAAIPILAGGNGFLVKPAENTLGCGFLLQDLANECGMGNIFSVVNLAREDTSHVVSSPHIVGVTVTGSVKTGRLLAQAAGSAGKKSILELGGSDPFIVFRDASLKASVEAAFEARFANCGQVCIAAKRIIVEAPMADSFTSALLSKIRNLVPSDPLNDNTFLGPMARSDLRDTLHRQVEQNVAEGAILEQGGTALKRPGAWYSPTLLTNIQPHMTAFREELFGPVACVSIANDAEHALALANASPYGLSASLWTQDVTKGLAYAERIEAGSVFINRVSASDPNVPIGGIKSSGYGRELTDLGLYEFLNLKTVWKS